MMIFIISKWNPIWLYQPVFFLKKSKFLESYIAILTSFFFKKKVNFWLVLKKGFM
jgi:hypothetical protein